MLKKDIIDKLPYAKPFLFVDEVMQINGDGAQGTFTFDPEMDFYEGHFKEQPITPGVILTECCAQIGLVCLGIYLLEDSDQSNMVVALSSSEMEFFLPVHPGEKVRVISEKVYFRFNKLKCRVKMYNEKKELVCKGVLAGMLKI